MFMYLFILSIWHFLSFCDPFIVRLIFCLQYDSIFRYYYFIFLLFNQSTLKCFFHFFFSPLVRWLHFKMLISATENSRFCETQKEISETKIKLEWIKTNKLRSTYKFVIPPLLGPGRWCGWKRKKKKLKK